MGKRRQEEPISESERIRRVYREYDESPAIQGRWSWENPGNQRIAIESFDWIRQALDAAGFLPFGDRRILEVGCGYGGFVMRMLELGARRENIYGVDILADRIEACQRKYPGANFSCQNAERLEYPDAFFHVALLMTVFSSIFDDSVASSVAREVRRVLAPGGAVVWWDMRYPNPWNRHVRAVPKSQIHRYFSGLNIQLATTTLIPGLARRLGRYTDKGYGILAAVPFLRSHWAGLFRKNSL